jgi:hypothetical protein
MMKRRIGSLAGWLRKRGIALHVVDEITLEE